MNGAESVVRTLRAGGVEVCFANPGTSELQYVDALDRTGLMRCVLGLHETVATGAADGYARMAGKPALTLLHLAPGVANGAANLHNARKARTPMLTLIGDHAVRHLAYDAPLTADVAGAAAPFADWVRTAETAAGLGADAAAALAAAMGRGGRGAALISPADLGWDEGGVVAAPVAPAPRAAPDPQAVEAAARALRDAGPDGVLHCGGATLEDATTLRLLAGVAAATGARLLAPTANRRIERGGGLPRIDKVPYGVEAAQSALASTRALVLVEAQPPLAFFAYPGRPSLLSPPGCALIDLAARDGDGRAAVAMLAEALGAAPAPRAASGPAAVAPQPGPITPASLPGALAAALPERAVVVDEGLTAARGVYDACGAGPALSWLAITGGAIGIGPPLALGAAVAAPDRPVVAVQADGSAMYAPQAWWSQAREGANVTTVLLANRGYEILKGELARVGVTPGPAALDLLEMARPTVDFVSLARGMGAEALRVDCVAALSREIAAAAARPGPVVIEATIA